MIAFRDATARKEGVELLVHTNEEGVRAGIGPLIHGSVLYTEVIKTEALRHALDRHGFDAAIGGARRDEEKSRAEERGAIAAAIDRACTLDCRDVNPYGDGQASERILRVLRTIADPRCLLKKSFRDVYVR